MLSFYLIASTLFVLQDIEAQPQRMWRTPSEIVQHLNMLDNSHDSVSISIIGQSTNGTPIQCVQIAKAGDIPIENRSAVLVVAGIDGDQLLGTEVATDLIEGLLSMEAEQTKV